MKAKANAKFVAVCGVVAILGTAACGSKTFTGSKSQKEEPKEVPAPSSAPPAESPSKSSVATPPAVNPPAGPAPTVATQMPQSNGNAQPAVTATGWTAESLSQACKTFPRKTETVVVQIPGNDGFRCEFGKNGNLDSRAATLAARLEQNFSVPLTQGRVLCSLTAESGNQLIRYDDQMFLTLNGNVLVTSSASVAQLDKAANGFHQYNWEKIRGAGTKSTKFCADGVSCNLPATETTGNFNFVISEASSNRLLAGLAGQGLILGLVVTGDNDLEKDCQLDTGMNLKVTYSYITQ